MHELLHTLGAVPPGAPHSCPGASAGHTCDNPNDLMYPSTAGEPLSAKILDPGRDDYYGHSGGWIDTQDSPWLVHLGAQTPLVQHAARLGLGRRPRPPVLRDLHDHVEHRTAPRADRHAACRRAARALDGRVHGSRAVHALRDLGEGRLSALRPRRPSG